MNSEKKQLFWVDGLKAFAIIGILINHFVESFGSFPWFSNPSYKWPDLATRVSTLLPADGSLLWKITQFIGWLGDMGPGVFIFLSGFTLTLSAFNRNEKTINLKKFYIKRLSRIFPLYLFIHLLIIIIGFLLKENPADLNSPRLFLSMLGLRFTEDLFFYINPSWWFIWLIIQLYIIFPFLFTFMKKKGIQIFFLVTLGTTILFRLAGLLNLTYAHNLEFWMTGLFCGTRLFEFTAGMIFAQLFLEKKFDPWNISIKKIFTISLTIYAIGFICSLFYPTTLISNILITLGLCGLFLSFCKIINIYFPSFLKIISWIGAVSFPVFLIHQPLMLWIGNNFNGNARAAIEILVLILVLPTSYIIEITVNRTLSFLPYVKSNFKSLTILLSLFFQIILNVGFFLTGNDLIYKSDAIIFIINIFFIPLWVLVDKKEISQLLKVTLFTYLSASILFMFILTESWFGIFWIIMFFVFIFLSIAYSLTKRPLIIIPASFLSVIILLVSCEVWLRADHPVETNVWGELPVLQKDTSTLFSLIPNKKTHLKYNNYDYFVNTNSLGFNGPEVKPTEKEKNEIRILVIGDAFTMPEGLEYEKAYPELLQMKLNEKYPQRKIIVYNAGVTGFGPIEMYAQLKKYIDIIKPDLYINQLFINEFEEINLSAEQRWNSIGLGKLSIRNKLFSGWQFPVQVASEVHRALKDRIYSKYTYDKSLLRFYDRNSNLYNEETLFKMRNYLNDVKSICELRNCKYYVLYAPGQIEISKPDDISYYPYHINIKDTIKFDMNLPNYSFKKLCAENHIVFLDPKEILRGNKTQPLYFTKSWHWNDQGHNVLADFLVQKISLFFCFK